MQGQPEATKEKGRTDTYSIGRVVGWSVTGSEVHHTDTLTSSVEKNTVFDKPMIQVRRAENENRQLCPKPLACLAEVRPRVAKHFSCRLQQ
jgi:hypothetical protein